MDLLQRLVESHGTPGYEEAVQRVIRQELQATCQQVSTDVLGSVMGVLNPDGNPRLLIDAHADEIGFVVRFIDDKGFLFVTPSGGWDAEVAVAQRVWVHTEGGPRPGVFGKRAVHLMDAEERKKKSELEKMWVDIGAKDGEQAREWVMIGDYVTVNATYTELPNGLAVAKSFDNRAGCYVICETMRALHQEPCQAAVTALSAVQEEIGSRGARTATHAARPEVGIAIDVCHAVDYPEGGSKKSSTTRLGGGPAIARGPNINPVVFRRLLQVARDNDIPYQIIATAGGTSTDANVIQLTRSGVATALVSVPLRYMHTPCETIARVDLDNTVRLLAAFARSLAPGDSFIPE